MHDDIAGPNGRHVTRFGSINSPTTKLQQMTIDYKNLPEDRDWVNKWIGKKTSQAYNYASKYVKGINWTPAKIYEGARAASDLYAGDYWSAAYHAIRARNSYARPSYPRRTKFYRNKRLKIYPSRHYRYRQAYRRKWIPYHKWLKQKRRNRTRSYYRRGTTWNY